MNSPDRWGRRTRRRVLLKGLLTAVVMMPLALAARQASAQSYPSKPITAIVPFAAGGGADTLTRIWGEAIAPLIGHRIIVENVPATSGVAGTKQGIAADPDGYTVVIGVASTIAINPVTNKAATYKPLEDLQPVALIGYTPYVMVAANNLKVKTLKELIAYGKAHEGELTYAGWTAVGEFARKGLERHTGLKLTAVPYKGSSEAMTDVIAGRASATILDISSALPFIRPGSVTPIVMTGPDKSQALPQVESIDEAGFKGYFIDSWTAMFAPKSTPKPIVELLNAKTREALQTEKAKARFADLAIDYRAYDVKATEDFMQRQVAGWKTLIEQSSAPK